MGVFLASMLGGVITLWCRCSEGALPGKASGAAQVLASKTSSLPSLSLKHRAHKRLSLQAPQVQLTPNPMEVTLLGAGRARCPERKTHTKAEPRTPTLGEIPTLPQRLACHASAVMTHLLLSGARESCEENDVQCNIRSVKSKYHGLATLHTAGKA